MKAKIILLLSVVTMVGYSSQHTDRDSSFYTIPQKYQICENDSDCTTVMNRCGGCACGEPINKKHSEMAIQEVESYCTKNDGPVCTVLCLPTTIECRNNQCVATSAE